MSPRKLYLVDVGASYWIVAYDEQEALRLLKSEYGHEYELEEELTATEQSCRDIGAAQFRIDGEDGSCPMWLAYLLVRDHASTVLACSEW